MATGTSTAFPTMIAIDHRFPGLVGQLPAGTASRDDAAILRKLSVQTSAKDALPAVVDAELARQLVKKDIAIYVGPQHLFVHVIGITHFEPTGYLSGPFFYVDLASLNARVGNTAKANTLLVTGAGAAAAVATLPVAHSAVHSRASWLADRRQFALVSGVQSTMLLASTAVALLAMIALIATVLAGARERGRSLSLMRTLGMRAGLGWWLALAELVPVVIAALVGGIVAGVGMVVWLEPSLGLDLLAGGQEIPPPSVSPILIIGLAAGAVVLLGVSVLAEVVAHRRDKLSEVLRVGETV
jgi:putative ABC transport system permease protein